MLNVKFDLDALLKQRGKRHEGFIELASKIDGGKIRLPYIIICGKKDGPTLLVDSCHHGDEYEGTEGIIKAASLIDPDKLSGTFIGIQVLNLEAFADGQRVAKMDWTFQDMNRAYPGNPNGLITQRISHYYGENIVKKADYAISLHGGGNSLYLEPLCVYDGDGGETEKKSKEMAKAFGVNVLWRVEAKNLPFTGILGQYASSLGIPLISPEIGGQSVRHDLRGYNVDLCANGILNVMKHLKMIEGDAPEVKDYYHITLQYINTDAGGIHKPLKKPLERVKKGEILSEVTDFLGNKVGEVVAPYDGIVIGYWAYSTIHPGNWAFLYGKEI